MTTLAGNPGGAVCKFVADLHTKVPFLAATRSHIRAAVLDRLSSKSLARTNIANLIS